MLLWLRRLPLRTALVLDLLDFGDHAPVHETRVVDYPDAGDGAARRFFSGGEMLLLRRLEEVIVGGLGLV
jgi:hypothetical protein